MADGKTRGRPVALDTIIAAIAKANDCVVVTNSKKISKAETEMQGGGCCSK
jgi:hypothetical protein